MSNIDIVPEFLYKAARPSETFLQIERIKENREYAMLRFRSTITSNIRLLLCQSIPEACVQNIDRIRFHKGKKSAHQQVSKACIISTLGMVISFSFPAESKTDINLDCLAFWWEALYKIPQRLLVQNRADNNIFNQ